MWKVLTAVALVTSAGLAQSARAVDLPTTFHSQWKATTNLKTLRAVIAAGYEIKATQPTSNMFTGPSYFLYLQKGTSVVRCIADVGVINGKMVSDCQELVEPYEQSIRRP